LGNVISVAGFVYVLAKFFEARIIGECPLLSRPFASSWDLVADRTSLSWFAIVDEERHLVRFFGQDYVDFRNKVGTWLPAGLVAKAAR
jgi:protein-S-isoprenylcysteine O-methyltransferase Ste14